MGDHGIEGTGGMIGRTAIGNAWKVLGAYLGPEPLDQGRFAYTSLPADEDDLSQPGFALVPAAAQQPTFLLAPHQHWDGSHHKLLARAGCRQQATHPADHHRLCDAVEGVGAQRFQGKRALHQAGRHSAYDYRVGQGETFEPRGNVGRFPEC
jgi:hypothetical protein